LKQTGEAGEPIAWKREQKYKPPFE
jgi:hypothetical protein